MEAVGPQSSTFATLPGSPTKRSAVLTAAGSYLLHVRLGGVAVAGWPRALHATAAPSEASRWTKLLITVHIDGIDNVPGDWQ